MDRYQLDNGTIYFLRSIFFHSNCIFVIPVNEEGENVFALCVFFFLFFFVFFFVFSVRDSQALHLSDSHVYLVIFYAV